MSISTALLARLLHDILILTWAETEMHAQICSLTADALPRICVSGVRDPMTLDPVCPPLTCKTALRNNDPYGRRIIGPMS